VWEIDEKVDFGRVSAGRSRIEPGVCEWENSFCCHLVIFEIHVGDGIDF
jgi:hypothetical protein